MDQEAEHDREAERAEIPLNARELRAVQQGVAAMIMPVAGGWKVQYLSGLDFEQEHGRTYSTLDEATEAVTDLLPIVNSEAGRHRAREMEELLWLNLREEVRDEEE